MKQQISLSQHRIIWSAELEKLDDSRVSLERAIASLQNKFKTEAPSLKELGLISEVLVDAEERKERRKMLMQGFSETRSFPAGLKPVAQSLIEDGLASLSSLEQEAEIDMIDFAYNDECKLNPWLRTKQGDIVKFHELDCLDLVVLENRYLEFEKLQEFQRKILGDIKEKFSGYIDGCGGWTDDEHFRFNKIRLEYKHSPGLKLFLQRLKLEFPKKVKKSLMEHIAWSKKNLMYKNQVTCANSDFQQRYSQFIKDTLPLFLKASEQVMKNIKSERQREQLLERIILGQEKVHAWRETVRQDILSKEKEIVEQQQHEQLLQRELIMKRNKIHEINQQRVNEYKRHQESVKEFWEDLAEKLNSEVQHQHMIEHQKNISRTIYRQEEHERKMKQKNDKVLEIERLQLELEARLDLIRSQVAVHAERDWRRTIQPTQSWLAPKINRTSNLFENHGFTAEKVLKDKRAKISLALFDKGLHTSDYAREVLVSLCRRPLQSIFPSVICKG